MALARRSYFISLFKPYLQMTNQQTAENIICMYVHDEHLSSYDSVVEISYIYKYHHTVTLCGGFNLILPTHTHNICMSEKD